MQVAATLAVAAKTDVCGLLKDRTARVIAGGLANRRGECMAHLRRKLVQFISSAAGATIVEYAVALIVVTIVGAVVLGFGGNVAGIIDVSAGAF